MGLNIAAVKSEKLQFENVSAGAKAKAELPKRSSNGQYRKYLWADCYYKYVKSSGATVTQAATTTDIINVDILINERSQRKISGVHNGLLEQTLGVSLGASHIPITLSDIRAETPISRISGGLGMKDKEDRIRSAHIELEILSSASSPTLTGHVYFIESESDFEGIYTYHDVSKAGVTGDLELTESLPNVKEVSDLYIIESADNDVTAIELKEANQVVADYGRHEAETRVARTGRFTNVARVFHVPFSDFNERGRNELRDITAQHKLTATTANTSVTKYLFKALSDIQ